MSTGQLWDSTGIPFKPQTVDGVKYIPMPYLVLTLHKKFPCWGCAAHAYRDRGEGLCGKLSNGCGGITHGCVFIPDTEEGRLQYVIDKLEA